jgi:sodium transport system permease protein
MAWIIFKKELMDTLRDKRTLFIMIILPIILIPGIFGLITKFQLHQMDKANKKILNIAIIDNHNGNILLDSLNLRTDFKIFTGLKDHEIENLIQLDSLDLGIIIDSEFDNHIYSKQTGIINILFKSTEDLNIANKKITKIINYYSNQISSKRMISLNIDPTLFHPIKVNEQDIATKQEKIGKSIGGLLPYFFIIFCYMGSMYPAIDLGAGEKERGTLETLLSSSANRQSILIGKLGVVILAGLLSAFVSMLGLGGMLQFYSSMIPKELFNIIFQMITMKNMALIFLLLIPLNIFVGSLLLSISIFSKSFKEAQSLANPFMIIIIIPVYLGMMPGIELNFSTAIIPILNVTLATKELLAGTLSNYLLLVVIMSQIIIAIGAISFCKAWFNREETLFRST